MTQEYWDDPDRLVLHSGQHYHLQKVVRHLIHDETRHFQESLMGDTKLETIDDHVGVSIQVLAQALGIRHHDEFVRQCCDCLADDLQEHQVEYLRDTLEAEMLPLGWKGA